MRVAAVQLEITPSSRASTLQNALQLIDLAAEADPAPDLVVLPAFVDTYDAGSDSKLEYVYGPSTAACGFRARSWGVFVAVGIAEWARPLPRLKSVLFDRDGDPRLVQSLTRPQSALAERYQCGSTPLLVAKVLLGRIAILVDDDIVSEKAWREVVAGGAQLIVGTIGGASVTADSFESALTDLSKQFKRPCVVADMTTGGKKVALKRAGVSRIVDSGGKVLAAATTGEGGIITAELDLPETGASDKPLTAHGAGE